MKKNIYKKLLFIKTIEIMKKTLLILFCLPILVFGQLQPPPCNLSGLSVTMSPNTNSLEATWGANFTYFWSNANLSTTQSVPYYPNWCVHIFNTSTGCDTAICETPFPCAIPFLHVLHDTINNILEASQVSSNFAYSWSNGATTHHTPYYPNWCLYVVDTSGCDTTICEGNILCVDSSLINPNVMCPQVYQPVCGCDSITYSNDCVATNYGGVTSFTQGPCNTNPCQVEIDGDSIICNWGDSILLEASPTATSTPFVSYVWSTGATGHLLSTTANFPGAYSVLATDSAGCVSTASFTVSVEDIIIYSTPSPPHICLGDSIVMWLNSVLPINNIVWGPTGDTTTTIVEFPTISTTYIVEALDANGCERRGEIFVIIDSCNMWPCAIPFLHVLHDTINNILEASQTSSLFTYHWLDTNGQIIDTNHFTPYYPNWCLYVVDTSGCDTIICEGNINPGPCQAMFYFSPGFQPSTFEFYDWSTPTGNITSWLWDFGDGTTSNQQNPIHTYSPNTPSGFYWVCLTIQSINPNGNVCTSIYCDSLYIQNIQANCQASFYYADLGNNTAHFTNTSMPMMPPPGHIIEFDLDYGDGTIDYNIGGTTTHVYPSSGTYYACLTMWGQDSSGTVICTDTYCDSVTVTPGGTPCQADFTYLQDSINIITNPNGTTSVVLGNIFYFIDLSMPIGMISTWSWDMGDFGLGTYHQGTSSSSQFPVYEYDTSGTYYVCLTITTLIGGNTCSSTYCDTIYAYPGPPPTGIFVHDRIKEVNIYPNPANNVLNINMLLKQSGEVEINLINMMGQKMITNKSYLFYENSNVSMDVSSLPNGIYTIEVIIDNSKLQQKLIISK